MNVDPMVRIANLIGEGTGKIAQYADLDFFAGDLSFRLSIAGKCESERDGRAQQRRKKSDHQKYSWLAATDRRPSADSKKVRRAAASKIVLRKFRPRWAVEE